MRILYIAPRYHTNQTAMIHGWQLRGDQVFFLARTVGPTEDHSLLFPDLIPYSRVFLLLEKLYIRLHRRSEMAHNVGLRLGFPPYRKTFRYIQNIRPDLVVLREKSVYSAVCYAICKRLRIRSVLYNQTPLFLPEERLKRDFWHRVADSFTPKTRYTPVRVLGWDRAGRREDPDAFYAPFVMEPHCPASHRTYMADGNIHLLDVGKFERRKNHLLLLKVFHRLTHSYPKLRLLIVGEFQREQYREYYEEVLRFIADHQLQDRAEVRINLTPEQMPDIYRAADLFVLPSTGEPAAISPLEAMSYSVPAVCSDGNGTAEAILPGKTGDIFADNDEQDLYAKLLRILEAPDCIPAMGERAYARIESCYSFQNYYDALMGWYQAGAGKPE